jgi:hypothetical protein
MVKKLVPIFVVLLGAITFTLSLAGAPSEKEGTWSLSTDSGDAARVQLQMQRRHGRHSWSNSHPVALSELTGLPARLRSAPRAEATFTQRRHAGPQTFRGPIQRGEGAGHFTFTPDPSFEADMKALGYDLDEDQLFSAASLDLSRAFVREVGEAGYRDISLDKLFAFRIHGATPAYIRSMREAGFSRLSADSLVAFRIHGVSQEFLSAIKAAGIEHVSADDAVAMRIHGATPAFLEELGRLGYRELSADELVAFRIHGVTPGFIEDVQELGYRHPTPDDLVAMRIHGVSASFIRRANERHGSRYSLDDIVAMKIHGRRWED